MCLGLEIDRRFGCFIDIAVLWQFNKNRGIKFNVLETLKCKIKENFYINELKVLLGRTCPVNIKHKQGSNFPSLWL